MSYPSIIDSLISVLLLARMWFSDHYYVTPFLCFSFCLASAARVAGKQPLTQEEIRQAS